MRRPPLASRLADAFVPVLAPVLVLAACTGAPAAPIGSGGAGSSQPPAGWKTDFSSLEDGVRLEQFIRATRGRDAIPALDEPRVTSVSTVGWIGGQEPVIAASVADEWRAYPLRILVWHEIVNDRLGGQPIAVTFCPLCHTSVVFDRRHAGEVLDFGVTGYLRRSDLVMYDRQTETWWQQATGVGLVGEHAGAHLTILPSSVVSWSDFVAAHPDATVLDRETGFDRPYGRNPYPGWDRVHRNPFLGASQLEPCGGVPGCLDPKERVGVVTVEGETVVYQFSAVADAGGLVHDTIGRTPIIVWWLPEVSSVLDSELIERSDQVGTLVAFDRRLHGETLEFQLDGGELHDITTESRWNSLGQAVAGPRAGERLVRLQVDTPYWFGFAAFGAGYEIWTADDERGAD